MKLPLSLLLSLLLCLSACQEDTKARALQQEREAQKQELIFNNISEGWRFNTRTINETSRSLTNNWSEWRLFLSELSQKPKSSLGAFQQKAKTLSKRASDMNHFLPIAYDLPEVKSRIAVIATKINSINLYIHLHQIPDRKIVQLIQETNIELVAFQQKLDEITRKSQIKIEDGEGDMLKMLDTTRAIPSSIPPSTSPNPKLVPSPLLNPLNKRNPFLSK